MPAGLVRSPSRLFAPLPALYPLGVIHSPRSDCRLSGRAAGRIFRAVVLCGAACRSLLAVCRSFLHVGRLDGVSADCLLCVPRLGVRCVRRGVCPAAFVPIIGAGGEAVRLPSSACLDGAGGVCGLCELPFIG